MEEKKERTKTKRANKKPPAPSKADPELKDSSENMVETWAQDARRAARASRAPSRPAQSSPARSAPAPQPLSGAAERGGGGLWVALWPPGASGWVGGMDGWADGWMGGWLDGVTSSELLSQLPGLRQGHSLTKISDKPPVNQRSPSFWSCPPGS